MTIRKPSIPVVHTTDKTTNLAFAAIRETLEIMTGVRNGTAQINQLPSAATNDEIITKINEIIAKLNYSGQ
jgi:hypothetical protein